MKLAQFINDHLEDILVEWDTFAATLPPAIQLSHTELRDNGKEVLQEIARDIGNEPGTELSSERAKFVWPRQIDPGSAAASHGGSRHQSGFTLVQLIAEYRALRAIVLRLWMPRIRSLTSEHSHELIRFNDAMDRAIAESASIFSERNAQIRDTFLAILGHDLRSPLATMAMAGAYLSRPGVGTDATVLMGNRVKRSAATMMTMISDLLEYARTQLGGMLPLNPQLADVREICLAAVADAQAAHPDCAFELETRGELLDDFDGARLQQVFSNLLNNAAQYRSKDDPVTILAKGEPEAIVVKVKNSGPVIPTEALQKIFDPMIQLHGEGRPSTNLGLGLFIAREITVAHGGTIDVDSGPSGTVFTVRLPRAQAL